MQKIDPDRREFFGWSFKVLGAVGLMGILYPITRFLGGDIDVESHAGIEPARGANARKPPVAGDGNSVEIDAGTVPEGAGMILTMGSVPVILVRNGNRWRAFNATCTHLGCLVKWDQAGQRFVCPCHGGLYNSDGKVTAGPPPAALAEHRVTLAGNTIRISRA
ncbi:MAG: ubiquinol-cytochrome c reductase iron-sulfur subunit [Thermodesulfobacteriota bacterium]